MNIVNPSIDIIELNASSGIDILKKIELIGRTCYNSRNKITSDSYINFIKHILKRGHFSVIEHHNVTARILCDRGVTHELVRHRIGSYSQESTRYINYKEGITVINPLFFPEEEMREDEGYKFIVWRDAMYKAERSYRELIQAGAKPEEARSVLPNSLKTEIVVTFNLREWRHFFAMRTVIRAHPQIRQVAIMLLEKMKESIPIIFEDFKIDKDNLTAETGMIPVS